MLDLNPEQFILKPVFATIHCEPNWQWKKRDKPFDNYDLLYVWRGEGTLVLNGKSYDVRKGHCFLFKPGDVVTATHIPQSPLVLTYIHFDLTENPQLVPTSHRVVENTISFESLLTRYVRLLLVKPFGMEIEARLILKQIMIHLLREAHEKVEHMANTSIGLLETVREVANYIQQHPGEQHSIEGLATRANLSQRYFSQKFKEITGHTVRSYIIRSRIERAVHLLHYSGLTVTEVASVLGYSDLHFFSRQFKKYTGKNPSDIR